jgi:hypothetical protein
MKIVLENGSADAKKGDHMERPDLNEVPADKFLTELIGGTWHGVFITMSIGQWDRFLQVAYDTGHVLLELDEDEVPVRTYRKRSGS